MIDKPLGLKTKNLAKSRISDPVPFFIKLKYILLATYQKLLLLFEVFQHVKSMHFHFFINFSTFFC